MQLPGEGGTLQLTQYQTQSFMQGNISVPIVSHINILNYVEKTQRNISVLVLAGIEFIFFLVAGIASGILYENNVDDTLMVSVVAKWCLY